jgi:hypothetical protein
MIGKFLLDKNNMCPCRLWRDFRYFSHTTYSEKDYYFDKPDPKPLAKDFHFDLSNLKSVTVVEKPEEPGWFARFRHALKNKDSRYRR